MSNVTNVVNAACNTAVNAGWGAVGGYLLARMFTTINPVNGAVFGAVASVVSSVTNPVLKAIFEGKNSNDASKFIGKVLNITASIAASAHISGALGYPVSLKAAATVTLAPAAVVYGIALSIMGLAAIIYCVQLTKALNEPRLF